MQLIQTYTTQNPTYLQPKKITVKGIVLHSTGCAQPKASAYISAFNNPNLKKSVHAFIQADGQVYQTLPWDYRAWHVGSGKNGTYNTTHIGIEMCEPGTIKYVGGTNWEDLNPEATRTSVMNLYKHSVELFAYLCNMYHLNPLQDEVIVSHYEANKRGKGSTHVDPAHIWNKFGLTMDQFRSDVAKAMSGVTPQPVPTPTPTPQPTPTPSVEKYLAQVNVDPGDSLNVRATPNGNVVSKLGRNFIVGVESVDAKGWAKLIQGGYVYNKYLTKFSNGIYNSVSNFTVQILVDSLNVRKTPDASSASNIVGMATKGQVLTIVATANNGKWGLLKSGLGYISIDPKFVQKR